MELLLKNTDQKYNINNLIEKKAFKGDKTGWLMSFMVEGDFNSDNIDGIFTEENISEMTVYENEATSKITGYEKVLSLTIHHTGIDKALVEVQLSKGL